jgi:hypothetical protein
MSQYPYQAFLLTPTFKVQEVTVAGRHWYGADYVETSKGKACRLSTISLTRSECIQKGFEDLEHQELAISKRQATIAKRRANLEGEQP